MNDICSGPCHHLATETNSGLVYNRKDQFVTGRKKTNIGTEELLSLESGVTGSHSSKVAKIGPHGPHAHVSRPVTSNNQYPLYSTALQMHGASIDAKSSR
jgi:hypothetical protein